MPLCFNSNYSPEGKIKQLEKKVNELVEESCIAHSCGDLKLVSHKLSFISYLKVLHLL